MTSGGSRRRECLKPAKKQALRRPERCAAPVQPCLSLPEPPPRRERRHAFPGSRTRRRHLAGRVPRAKRLGRRRRNPHSGNLHTAFTLSAVYRPGSLPVVIQRRNRWPSETVTAAAPCRCYSAPLPEMRLKIRPRSAQGLKAAGRKTRLPRMRHGFPRQI